MYDCAIVVPCHNEGLRLVAEQFIRFSDKHSLRFIFVDDGSTDHTYEILLTIQKHSQLFEIIRLKEQSGKAEAVRQGIVHGLSIPGVKIIGYIDADLATPLDELIPMYELFQNRKHYCAVTGLRLRRLGCNVNRSYMRHYLGRIFATFVSLVLHLPTYDTQCGAKLFTISMADRIFKEKFHSAWFFDVEIFFRIIKTIGREETINRVCEFPLSGWNEIKGSKLKLKHYLLAPFELFHIYFMYKKYMR